MKKTVFLRCLCLLTACQMISAAVLAAPVPIPGVAPVPVERLRVDNPAVLPMTGTWKFHITAGEEKGTNFVPDYQCATASISQNGHPAIDALGGSGDYWVASNGTFPQWWQVDLHKTQAVDHVTLTFEDPTFKYQGRAEASDDGKTWVILAELNTAGAGKGGDLEIPATIFRFLRVTFYSGENSAGEKKWAFVRHAAITVTREGKQVAWNPADDAEAAKLAGFAAVNFDARGFSDVPVPSNWEVLGFSKPTYDNPKFPEDAAVGLYRREVEVPERFAGQRVLWHFDGVFETAEVFINGRRVGLHESGFTAFDLDVTDFIRPGEKNLFAVRVCKIADSVDLDTGDYWALGGIYRETYLLALPPTHVDDALLTTTLDENHADATLDASIHVAGAPGQPFQVDSQLFDRDGTKAATPVMTGTGTLDAAGKAVVPLSQHVAAPKLWSAEKPNLYYLVTTLSTGGKPLERTQERFGFRQIEIKDGVLLWNGVPIKCTGTCRHEEWSALGHALTEHEWQTDTTLMKADNINAVRTSHYIDAERFLELCDEKGFYILDEIPFCWADPKKESYLAPYLQRVHEAYARDKNKPCVLAWSIGNESGFGPVNNAGFTEVRRLDPTRPAFISEDHDPALNPAVPIMDYHYPDLKALRELIANPARQTKPALITEGPHTFYTMSMFDYDDAAHDLWGEGLLAQWKLIWPADHVLGAFIWEWQDQGLKDKFPDRTDVDAHGLRHDNHKGFLDGYRNIKPEYFNVAMVYSPVTIEARQFEAAGDSVPVQIQNRYSFTDLSELTCRWQAFAGGKQVDQGEKHVAGAPRSSGTASFPAVPGMDALRLEFVHPDGRTVYMTRLTAKDALPPVPAVAKEAGGAAVQLTEDGAGYRATVGQSTLLINKTTGAISSWTVGSEPMLGGNFLLNLGVNHSLSEHPEGEYLISSQPPRLKTTAVQGAMAGNDAKITVSSEVSLAETPGHKGLLVETYLLRPDGTLAVSWNLKWDAPKARVWELGLEIPLPPGTDNMQWRRDGLWTEYPPGHIAATEGRATPRDLTFSATKRNLDWLTMSAPGKPYALCLLSDGMPLHARGHAEAGGCLLYASALNLPVEQNLGSSLFQDRFIRLEPGQTYDGEFELAPVKTSL